LLGGRTKSDARGGGVSGEKNVKRTNGGGGFRLKI